MTTVAVAPPRGVGGLGAGLPILMSLQELAVVVLEDLIRKRTGAHASLELGTILVTTTVDAILDVFDLLSSSSVR